MKNEIMLREPELYFDSIHQELNNFLRDTFLTHNLGNPLCNLFFLVVGVLPSFTVVDFLSNSSVATSFLSWVSWANYYLPVDRLFNPVSTVIAAQVIGGIIKSLLDLL